MRIETDLVAKACYITLAHLGGKSTCIIDRTQQVGDDMMVDYDVWGHVIGIELLNYHDTDVHVSQVVDDYGVHERDAECICPKHRNAA